MTPVVEDSCLSRFELPGARGGHKLPCPDMCSAVVFVVFFLLQMHICMLPLFMSLTGTSCRSLPSELPCLPRRWRLVAACFAVWHLQTLQGSRHPADVCTSPASCGDLLRHELPGPKDPFGTSALPQPESVSLAAPQLLFRPSGSLQLQNYDPMWSAAARQPQPGPLRASSVVDNSRKAAQLQAVGQKVSPGSDVWQMPRPNPQQRLLAGGAQQRAPELGAGVQRWGDAGRPVSGRLKGSEEAGPTGSVSAKLGSVQPVRSLLTGAAEVWGQQPPSRPGRPAAGSIAARDGLPYSDALSAQTQSAAAQLPQKESWPQAGSLGAEADRAAEWLDGAAAVIAHTAAQKQELQQLRALLAEQQQQLAACQHRAAQDLQRAADVCVAEQVAALHRFGQATHSGRGHLAPQPAPRGRLHDVTSLPWNLNSPQARPGINSAEHPLPQHTQSSSGSQAAQQEAPRRQSSLGKFLSGMAQKVRGHSPLSRQSSVAPVLSPPALPVPMSSQTAAAGLLSAAVPRAAPLQSLPAEAPTVLGPEIAASGQQAVAGATATAPRAAGALLQRLPTQVPILLGPQLATTGQQAGGGAPAAAPRAAGAVLQGLPAQAPLFGLRLALTGQQNFAGASPAAPWAAATPSPPLPTISEVPAQTPTILQADTAVTTAKAAALAMQHAGQAALLPTPAQARQPPAGTDATSRASSGSGSSSAFSSSAGSSKASDAESESGSHGSSASASEKTSGAVEGQPALGHLPGHRQLQSEGMKGDAEALAQPNNVQGATGGGNPVSVTAAPAGKTGVVPQQSAHI